MGLYISVSASQTAADRNMLVYSSDPVTFTCNISENGTTLITWTNGRSVFVHYPSINDTFSNFSLERVKVDSNIPSKLSIIRTQHDDGGLYKCCITDEGGIHEITWYLTVLEKKVCRG